MATQKPLVRIDGRNRQLPAGDTIEGGIGSVGFTTVNLTVSPAQFGEANAVVFVAEVTSGSTIECFLVPNSEWEADDLEDHSIIATSETGSILFSIFCEGPIVGDYTIKYRVTA